MKYLTFSRKAIKICNIIISISKSNRMSNNTRCYSYERRLLETSIQWVIPFMIDVCHKIPQKNNKHITHSRVCKSGFIFFWLRLNGFSHSRYTFHMYTHMFEAVTQETLSQTHVLMKHSYNISQRYRASFYSNRTNCIWRFEKVWQVFVLKNTLLTRLAANKTFFA